MTSFQVELRGQWQNYDDREDMMLKMAFIAGHRSTCLEIRGDFYECDLDRMVQVNLCTGTERKMRAPMVHETKVSVEGAADSSKIIPGNPRRHSAPAITNRSAPVSPVVIEPGYSGRTDVPALFRRQGHVREDRMHELLSMSKSAVSMPRQRRTWGAGYPGGYLQHAQNTVADRVQSITGKRHQKHAKQPSQDKPVKKSFAVMDASFGVLEEFALGEFEEFLGDSAVDLL